MIKITDNVLLDKYINNTGISKLFSQDINNYLELFSLNKGDFLINEGECSNYLYFLVSGKLKVFSHSTSGKIMSITHFNSFEIIGKPAVYGTNLQLPQFKLVQRHTVLAYLCNIEVFF